MVVNLVAVLPHQLEDHSLGLGKPWEVPLEAAAAEVVAEVGVAAIVAAEVGVGVLVGVRKREDC